MTKFSKERGETQSMASESYEVSFNFNKKGLKIMGKPKALAWDAKMVQTWFNTTLKFQNFDNLFLEMNVTGDVLFDMKDSDFQDCGMTIPMQRKRVLNAIEDLKKDV